MLSIAALALSTAAHAQEIDFGAIKCATYLEKVDARNAEAQSEQPGSSSELKTTLQTVHVWLYGYASAKAGATTMSAPEAVDFTRALGERCAANPGMDIANVAEDALRALGDS